MALGPQAQAAPTPGGPRSGEKEAETVWLTSGPEGWLGSPGVRPFGPRPPPPPANRCSRAQGLRQAPTGLPEVPPLPPGSPQIFLEGRPMCGLAGGGVEAPRSTWVSPKRLHTGPWSEGT